jgi:hypothetical protein
MKVFHAMLYADCGLMFSRSISLGHKSALVSEIHILSGAIERCVSGRPHVTNRNRTVLCGADGSADFQWRL